MARHGWRVRTPRLLDRSSVQAGLGLCRSVSPVLDYVDCHMPSSLPAWIIVLVGEFYHPFQFSRNRP